MKTYIYPLLLILLGIVAWLPSFWGPLFWDDVDFITSNTSVTSFTISDFFTKQAVHGSGKLSNYFRPIQFTTYAILYKFFGENAAAFHTTSVTFHILAALAVFFFLKKLLAKPTIAFTTAALFLVHPVQAEAVSYVSGLSDPLVALFGFLSLYCFTNFLFARSSHKKTPKQVRWYAASIFFIFLTLLSKESGIIFLLLVTMLVLFQRLKLFSESKKDSLLLPCLLPFFMLLFAYIAYHSNVIDVVHMKDYWGAHPYAEHVFIRLSQFLSLIPAYIGILLFPKNLFYERDFTITILQTPWHLPSLVVLCIIASVPLIIWNSQKHQPEEKNQISRTPLPQHIFTHFLFLSFFIAFLPFSGIVLINGIFYEHFLYVPMIFFFAFFLVVLNTYARQFLNKIPKKILFTGFAILCMLLILRSWIRQKDWQDPVGFYKQTLTFAPKSFRVRNNLATMLHKTGNLDDAIEQYTQAIALNDTIPAVFYNLARAYEEQGDFSQAEKFYAHALTLDPTFHFALTNLLALYDKTKQTDKKNALITQYEEFLKNEEGK